MTLDWIIDAQRSVELVRMESLARLVLAAVLGGLVGLEREASGKPAGFRTNLIICLGAALVMEVSVAVARGVGGGPGGDPGRIGAQIVSGIGFLGAGCILHFRGSVLGLTTAATLWVVAAIGMAVGAHAYGEAVGVTILVILTLRLLGRVEDHLILRRPTERTVDIVLLPEGAALDRLETLFRKAGFTIDILQVEKGADAYAVSLHVRGLARAWDGVIGQLLDSTDVKKVKLT